MNNKNELKWIESICFEPSYFKHGAQHLFALLASQQVHNDLQ